MNSKLTAAQPLDLDKLEAIAGTLDGNFQFSSADEIRALIAHARAAHPESAASEIAPADIVIDLRAYADNPDYSHNDYADTMRQAAHCIESMRAMFFNYAIGQPESATGTTGASIDTPEFQALVENWREQPYGTRSFLTAWDNIIAHIDAIIGDLRAQLARQTVELGAAQILINKYRRAVETSIESLKSRDAAPASAQPVLPEKLPDDVLRYVMECAGRNNPDGAREVKAIYTFLRDALLHPVAPASAQPDRGAMQIDYTVDDSELARKIMVFMGRSTTQSMEPGADPLRDRLAERLAIWRPAVAPSDAKGKADAANAGGLSFRERFADAYLSLSVAHFSSPFWNQSMEQLIAAVDAEINKRVAERGQSPATSAADAKDAARLDHLESWLGKSGARGFKWNSYDFIVGKTVREQIDAAMAVAPSSGEPNVKAFAADESELATLTAEIDRLERKLKNTPLRYSSDRFDIAMEIDKLKARRDKAAAPSSAADTEDAGGQNG